MVLATQFYIASTINGTSDTKIFVSLVPWIVTISGTSDTWHICSRHLDTGYITLTLIQNLVWFSFRECCTESSLIFLTLSYLLCLMNWIMYFYLVLSIIYVRKVYNVYILYPALVYAFLCTRVYWYYLYCIYLLQNVVSPFLFGASIVTYIFFW